MRLRAFSLLVFIYLIIGIIVAWKHGYLTLGIIKAIVSVLFAILLWFLVLLGVDLHIH